MKSCSELKQELLELANRVTEIHELASAEDRELTAAEKSELDQINGIGSKGGKIAALQVELERASKIDNALKLKAAQRFQAGDEYQASGESFGKRLVSHTGDTGVLLAKGDKFPKPTGEYANMPANAFGEFLRAKACGVNHRTHPAIKAALSTGDNSAGGFMVPNPLGDQVLDLARNRAVVFGLGAQLMMMESGTLNLAMLLTDPAMEIKNENDSFNEASVTFGGGELRAYTIGCVLPASRELVEDAPNFAMLIESALQEALAVQFDKYALQGTGVGQPTGLVNNPDIVETDASVGTITWSDVTGPASTLRESNYEPNAFVARPRVIDTLMNAVGTSNDHYIGKPPSVANLLMPGTMNMEAGKAVIGDFTQLIWGVRRGVQVEVSQTAGDAFKKHQVLFKVTMRGDTLVMRRAAFLRMSGIS